MANKNEPLLHNLADLSTTSFSSDTRMEDAKPSLGSNNCEFAMNMTENAEVALKASNIPYLHCIQILKCFFLEN